MMKRLIKQALVPALFMMIPLCLSAEEAATRIVVHDGVEFIKALGSNRTVVIAAGTSINLTDEVLGDMVGQLKIQNIELIVNPNKVGKNGILQYSYEFDGSQLHIAYMKNLTIEGEGLTRPVIQVRPRYTYILSFDHCENITLRNLEMGHTDEGSCQGGVVNFLDCKDIEVDNCDMYGCGTEGITATDCTNLQCERSIIRDCSYYIMTLNNVKGKLNFNECQFLRNREFSLVNADVNCSKLNFIKCLFKDNQGLLFAVKSAGLLDQCTIIHDYDLGDIEEFKNRGSEIIQDGDHAYSGAVDDDYDGDDAWDIQFDESTLPLQYYQWQGDYMKMQLRMALCRRGNVFIGEALFDDSAYPISVRGLMDNDGDVTLSLLNTHDPNLIDFQFTGKVNDNGFTGNDVSSLKPVKLKNAKGNALYAIDRNANGFASPWHKNNVKNFEGKDADFAGMYQYMGPLDKQGIVDFSRNTDDMNSFTFSITCKTGAYQYENTFKASLVNRQLVLDLAPSNSENSYIVRIRFYEGFITITRLDGSPEGVIPSDISIEGIYFEVPSVG